MILTTWYDIDISKPIQAIPLQPMLVTGDNKANRIGVRLYNGGQPYSPTGSCRGFVLRRDGATVPIMDGVISGNEAYIDLPETAYAVQGAIVVSVVIVTPTSLTTVFVGTGSVLRTQSSVIVDPGVVIEDIGTLIQTIEAAVASIPADYSDLMDSVAPAYTNLSFPVAAGQLCWYSGVLYRAIVDIPVSESWTASHWETEVIGNDLAALKEDVLGLARKSGVLDALHDTIESGKRKKWTTAELTQGYWTNRAIVTIDTAVCTAQVYHVNAGDTIRFSNNTDGLYFAYAVYLSPSGSSDASGWITGVEHEHTFTASGNLFVQFVNAYAAADRTEITPADITLDFGILDKGYVINSIAALNRNLGDQAVEVDALHDTIESGMRKKWTTDELAQGYWQNRVITESDLAVCTASLYHVNAGDVIRFSNNTDGLYFAYGVDLHPSGSSDKSGWLTGVEHEHTFTASGDLWVQFVNALDSADRTPITPADITLDFGILDNGYVVESIASINRNLGDQAVEVDALHDTIESGMRKKWTTAELTQGYWASRAIVTSDIAVCTAQLYPVEAGDTIRFSNNTDGLYFAYSVYLSPSGSSDASGWITGVEHEHTFTASGNLFVQFVDAYAAADRTEITPADITLDFGILDKSYVINSIAAQNRNLGKIINLGTKTLAFLGDSITAGVGTNYIYHMYLGDRFGWTCKNYGYGGSGYARSYPSTGGKMATGQTGMGVTITSSNKFEPNDFLTRIATIPTDIDGLVIFGGTNDWAHGDVISVADFTAAVRNVLSYAQTNFGRIPILVLLPIHRGSDSTPNSTTGKTLLDYCDIIRTVCAEYGVRCIDLYAESGLNPANANNNTLYYTRDDTNVSDSLHPNHYAHKMISNLIASALYDALY